MCSRGVALRDLHRHVVITVSVEHELVDAEGHSFARRRKPIDVRAFSRVSEERPRRFVRGWEARGENEVEDARLRDRGADLDPWARTRRLRWKSGACCEPEGKLSSGGVADRDHPREVEACRKIGKRVDPGSDVVEGLGPTAARSNAPVLEIPGREAVLHKVGAEPVHQGAVVTRTPVAAVHDDDDRMSARTAGQEELCDLTRIAAVRVH